jgi:hypothetical protein
MKNCFRVLSVLLLALALLAGCDVSSPSAAPSPLPTAGAIPEVPTTGAPVDNATPNGTAYPAPESPTVPPGYVPPATAQP